MNIVDREKPVVVHALWRALGDVAVDDDGKLQEDFLGFPVGTDREEIWHWFEDTFDVEVHRLMYPNEHEVEGNFHFYRKHHGYQCPSCVTGIISAGEYTSESFGGSLEVTCENCGKKWIEFLALADLMEA